MLIVELVILDLTSMIDCQKSQIHAMKTCTVLPLVKNTVYMCVKYIDATEPVASLKRRFTCERSIWIADL